MNKVEYRKIEAILYKHYKKIRKLDRLKRRRNILSHKLEQIDKDIRTCNIEIKSYMQGISYDTLGEQTSQNIESSTERMIIKEIDKLQRDYERYYKERASIKRRIWDYEKKLIDIGVVLEYVCRKDEDYEKILQMKYGDGFSNVRIGGLINCSEYTVRKSKDKIIGFIYEELML